MEIQEIISAHNIDNVISESVIFSADSLIHKFGYNLFCLILGLKINNKKTFSYNDCTLANFVFSNNSVQK